MVATLKNMVQKAQREKQALRPPPRPAPDGLLITLGAALIALSKDPSNPEDRIHRRIPQVRKLLARALRHQEAETDPTALYARLGADMAAQGLDPQRPGDVLRFALKETEE